MNEELWRAHEERWNTLTRYAVSYVREVSKPTDYATDDDARWALVRELEAHNAALSCIRGYTQGLRPCALSLAARDTPPIPLRARALEIASGEKHAEILAVRVLEHVRRLLEKVWVEDLPPFGEGCPLVVDGVVWWVEGLAAFLEGLGPAGREEARAMRDEGKARSVQGVPYGALPPKPQPGADPWHSAFHRFLFEDKEGLPRWVRSLARVVWEDEVKAKIERRASKEERLVAPALAREVVRAAVTVGRVCLVGGRIVSREGARARLAYKAPAPAVSESVIEKGLERFGGVMFFATVRRMALDAYRLHVNDETKILAHYQGGPAGYARELGFTRAESGGQMRELLLAMKHTCIDIDTTSYLRSVSLLSDYIEIKPAKGRPAALRLELSPLFAPGVANALPEGHPDRVLIPVLATDPPLEAVNSKVRPAAVHLEWLALSDLQSQARDLVRRGSVELDWPELAERAGLPLSSLDALVASWVGSGRWVRNGAGRWTLGPAHEPAIELVCQYGEKSESARQRAAASPRKKRN